MNDKSYITTIGNTPHIRLSRLFPDHEVYLKLEKQNPGGSIKDRVAFAMIEDAEQKGVLQEGGVIIEPTSGNTGIGLAWIGRLKGYRVILTMPESMSVERVQLMKTYGAEILLTPADQGMKGAIAAADRLKEETPGSFIPQQFQNQANVEVHKKTTALEIIREFPEGFDYFISCVGTGGNITGIGEVLKDHFPSIKVLAVEPAASAVISGQQPGSHKIQGIGAGFIPTILNTSLLDGTIPVTDEEAFRAAGELVKQESILGGISTGAAIAATMKKCKELPKGTRILTINYDTGERYLSVKGLFQG